MHATALLGIAILASSSLGSTLSSTVPAAAAPVPSTSCQVFPADNVWNTDISTLPVHARSAQWLASMASTTNLHPDFGCSPYGFPFNVVDRTHATVSVTFQYASESDAGPYPLGMDTGIENGSDRHALIINKDTCTLYELFLLSGSGSTWSAGWIRCDLSPRLERTTPAWLDVGGRRRAAHLSGTRALG